MHYGSLDVEELGRVYEALLELEPGITPAPMSRLRRAKLEVVVPSELAARYRDATRAMERTRVVWVEDIPAGRFFLRAGSAARRLDPTTRRMHSFGSWCARRWRRRSPSAVRMAIRDPRRYWR